VARKDRKPQYVANEVYVNYFKSTAPPSTEIQQLVVLQINMELIPIL
jgi:hypothetical protein